MDLGARLKKARHERKMTLAQLAATTGLTKGFLSQVEHGRSLPSLGSLQRLSAALDVPVQAFVSSAAPQRPYETSRRTARLLRRDEWGENSTTSAQELTEIAGAHVSLIALRFWQTLVLDGGEPESVPENGAAICAVVAGDVTFSQGDVAEELAPGEAAVFDAFRQFTITNGQAAPATLLLVSRLEPSAFRVLDAGDSQLSGNRRIGVDSGVEGPLRLVAMRAMHRGHSGG